MHRCINELSGGIWDVDRSTPSCTAVVRAEKVVSAAPPRTGTKVRCLVLFPSEHSSWNSCQVFVDDERNGHDAGNRNGVKLHQNEHSRSRSRRRRRRLQPPYKKDGRDCYCTLAVEGAGHARPCRARQCLGPFKNTETRIATTRSFEQRRSPALKGCEQRACRESGLSTHRQQKGLPKSAACGRAAALHFFSLSS